MNEIYTIGHSNKDIDTLIAKLQSFSIGVLADVRSFPGSSRFPQFNRNALEHSLAGVGIAYVHLPGLGGKQQTGGYEAYMQTEAFKNELVRLKDFAKQKRVAYMCAEVSWRHCHRAHISEQLHKEGWVVQHISGVHIAERHSDEMSQSRQGKLFS